MNHPPRASLAALHRQFLFFPRYILPKIAFVAVTRNQSFVLSGVFCINPFPCSPCNPKLHPVIDEAWSGWALSLSLCYDKSDFIPLFFAGELIFSAAGCSPCARASSHCPWKCVWCEMGQDTQGSSAHDHFKCSQVTLGFSSVVFIIKLTPLHY